eukprot:2998457-Pleurochrysis_carterae.AAC.2
MNARACEYSYLALPLSTSVALAASAQTVNRKFTEINGAMEAFVAEMKAQNVWDDVTVIQASEFARTLVSNGRGTDHGWGGMHWVAGGKINGGRIFGKFPESFSPDSDRMLSRGRLVPSTSWEA